MRLKTAKILIVLYALSVTSFKALPQMAGVTKMLDNLTEAAFPDSEDDRYSRLTELDYERVAQQLGVEIATIKAVSDIEAGKSHHGFAAPGKPVLNFQSAMFRQRLTNSGLMKREYLRTHKVAFSPVNSTRYGSYAKAQYARLNSAMEINVSIAQECAYWGMFQIGGFNWRKCGVDSVGEFVELMGQSEAMQLELFARFVTSNNMVEYLRKRNWKAFAKAYNGPRAIKKGYHKRMATAYAKHKRQ